MKSAIWYGCIIMLYHLEDPRNSTYVPWTGPCRVVAKMSVAVHCLQHSQYRHKRSVHFDRLKPCSPDTRLPQVSRQRARVVQSPQHPPVGISLELLDDDFEYLDLTPETSDIDTPPDKRPPPADSSMGYLAALAPVTFARQ